MNPVPYLPKINESPHSMLHSILDGDISIKQISEKRRITLDFYSKQRKLNLLRKPLKTTSGFSVGRTNATENVVDWK